MRKFPLVLVALLTFSSAVFAQTAPEPVDIPSAQAEIDMLNQQNSDKAAENDQYEATNATLRTEIEGMEGLKRDISETQGKISSQAGELYTIMQTVNDAEMKVRLNAQITNNRSQRYALDQKTSDLNAQIEEHNYMIDRNVRWINRNILATKKNNARIAHLNASIAYTRDEGEGMDAAISKSQGIQSEVDGLLNQNPASSTIQ